MSITRLPAIPSLLAISAWVLVGCTTEEGSVDAGGGDAGTEHDSGGTGDAAAPTDGSVPDPDASTGVDASTPTEAEVLTADYAPYDLALGGGYVYFTEGNSVRRLPVTGGTVEQMFTTGSDSIATQGVAADEDRFAWTHRYATSSVGGQVHACPHSGCPDTPESFMHDEATNRVAIGGTIVAWTSASRLNVQGYTGTMRWQTPSSTSAPIDVEVDGTDVFWVRSGFVATANGAFTCDAGGGTCTPTLMSDAVGGPMRIAPHGDDVVVISDTGLFHMGRDGSDVTRLADGVSGGGDFVDVTTDGSEVYWASGGELFACSIADCAPRLVAEVTGGQGSRGLAMDDTAVYWATANIGSRAGAIRRVMR